MIRVAFESNVLETVGAATEPSPHNPAALPVRFDPLLAELAQPAPHDHKHESEAQERQPAQSEREASPARRAAYLYD